MVVKPVAIGERPVAANKNLRIQNSGRRDARVAPRRWAIIREEILTGDCWVRRTRCVLDRAAFQHAAVGFGVVTGEAIRKGSPADTAFGAGGVVP
jgi:hypothetical protein